MAENDDSTIPEDVWQGYNKSKNQMLNFPDDPWNEFIFWGYVYVAYEKGWDLTKKDPEYLLPLLKAGLL